MDDYIIQITLGILVILWSYYVLRIVLVGVKIRTKTTVAKPTKRKKRPLKTRLLKKLRKQAKKNFIIKKELCNNKEQYYLVRLYKKKEQRVPKTETDSLDKAIVFLRYYRQVYALEKVRSKKQEIKKEELMQQIEEENKKLAKL